MGFCLVGFCPLGFCHVGFYYEPDFLPDGQSDRLLDMSLFSPGHWPHLYKLILCNGCLPDLVLMHVLLRLCMSV